MEYLTKAMGVRVEYKECRSTQLLPIYIQSRYDIQDVELDGIRTAFVYPKKDTEPAGSIRKHLDRIEIALHEKPVLILKRVTSRQKDYLIAERIPFIVAEKQIYLPFMGTYLRDRCDVEIRAEDVLLPSAQVLLLDFIYHGCGELSASEAARELSFSAMSISRASRQLEENGLITTEKRGVGKVLRSDKTPEQLFEAARPFLLNPVKRTVYVPRKNLADNMLIGGFSALSEYSMLNRPNVRCYATDSISKWNQYASANLFDASDQCAVELWRYDPGKLTVGKCVDRLSLALAFASKNNDERTEGALEEMLEQTWREIDGKRD